MIRIRQGAFWCPVACDTPEEVLWLDEQCTLKSFFNPMSQTWGSIEKLYENGVVAGGLIPLLVRAGAEAGYQFEVTDDRPWDISEEVRIIPPGGLPPRDFQLEGARVALEQGAGIIQAGTGSGKTVLGAGIIGSTPWTRWLVLVPSPGLVKSWVTALEAHDLTVVTLKGNAVPDWQSDLVVVATWATVFRHLAVLRPWLEVFTGIMVDEVHTSGATTATAVIRACMNAHRRIGLSATPFGRSDGRDLVTVSLFGDLIFTVPTEELMDAGVVATPTITMVEFAHDSTGEADAYVKLKWAHRYSRCVVRNAARNRLLCGLVARANKPCIVFVREIEHVHNLTAMLEKQGHNVAWVEGTNKSKLQRENLIVAVNKGQVDVVVSSSVWEVGIDIPGLAAVIVGGAGKAEIGTVQRPGRSMRVTGTKDTCQVWDVYDRVYTALEKQAQARVRHYRSEGHEVLIEKLVNSKSGE